LQADNEQNREGYVLTYTECAPIHQVKVKVKFADYVRMHRIVTGVSPKAIWEMLASGSNLEQLEDTPEHFRKWAFQWRDKLVDEFNAIWDEAKKVADETESKVRMFEKTTEAVMLPMDAKEYRKSLALLYQRHAPKLLPVLFAMLDGQNPMPIIWKMIKPRGDDQSFRNDE